MSQFSCFINQQLYAKRNKLPLFAYNICPSCKMSLQMAMINKFKELAEIKAGSELITSCPNCSMSWCD